MDKAVFERQETSLIHISNFGAPASNDHVQMVQDYDLLLIVYRGRLWFSENDDTFTARAGDVVLHPQGIPYEEWSDAADPVHCLQVLFYWPTRPERIARVVTDEGGLMRQTSERLSDVWWREEERGGRAGRMLLEGLIGEYLALAEEVRSPLVRRVRQYTWQHLRTGFRLSDLAAHFGLNPHYFARKFQAEVGHGPMTEVRHLRLEWARKLALTTDLQVKAIARQTGFPNASYLSRLFSAHYSITIRQLRNSVIKR